MKLMEKNVILNLYCLDASCFTSLGRLKDLFQVLGATREMVGDITIYLPQTIHDAINLQPEEKFRVLSPLISEWIDTNEDQIITQLDTRERDEYVTTMRKILNTFTIVPFSFIAERDYKIGDESIWLRDLVTRLGREVGEILFEELSASVKLGTIIISYGDKTIELMRRFGSKVLEGRSELKGKIKERAGIKRALKIIQGFMNLQPVQNYLYSTQNTADPSSLASQAVAIANFGLLVIGDG